MIKNNFSGFKIEEHFSNKIKQSPPNKKSVYFGKKLYFMGGGCLNKVPRMT